MAGKNKGICHSCRQSGHNLLDCPTKKRCPKCGLGFEKCMEVEKNTSNMGRLFFCCTRDCGHFDWKDKEKSKAKLGCVCSDQCKATFPCQDLLTMFTKCTQIAEEKDIEISINITMRKGMGVVEDNGKGKAKVQ